MTEFGDSRAQARRGSWRRTASRKPTSQAVFATGPTAPPPPAIADLLMRLSHGRIGLALAHELMALVTDDRSIDIVFDRHTGEVEQFTMLTKRAASPATRNDAAATSDRRL